MTSDIVTHEESGKNYDVLPVNKPESAHMNLIEIAVSNGADISTLERLVTLQNEYEAKESRKLFFAALSKFQSEIPIITKRGKAGFDHTNGGGRTEYSFAKLEDITESIKPFLEPNGLSYRYEQNEEANQFRVTCIVTHKAGHEEKTSMAAMADKSGRKNLIQQIASTISYLRRYTLTGALGITVADEDDDAHQAPDKQDIGNQYPDDNFCRLFPAWADQIRAGEQSADSIIGFLESKGFSITDSQQIQLREVTR